MNHVLQTECSREQLEQQFMLGKDKTTAFLKEKLASSEVPDRRIPFPTSYTKELLRKWFAPIPHYQNLLVNVAARTVKSSERYVRCENDGGLLSFSLPAPIASGCDLKIEDTEEEKLYRATLDAGTSEVKIDLNEKNPHPGRYYWKLTCENGDFHLGEFFIEKELMEE